MKQKTTNETAVNEIAAAKKAASTVLPENYQFIRMGGSEDEYS